MADLDNKKLSEVLSNKCNLGFLPTPVHELERLNDLYPQYRIFIKRDDQTGLATGGNKTRKLEYLIQAAIDNYRDTVITAGAQQSNHCRQTAAAAAQLGLKCHLLLGGEEPSKYSGNLLLSKLLGAIIHFSSSDRKGEQLPQLKKDLESSGHRCYTLPYGGSNLIGSLGFVNAMAELKEQENELGLEFDHIVFASSSGGTQAGLILGKELFGINANLHAISIDKEGISGKALEDIVLKLVNEGSEYLSLGKRFSNTDCQLNRNYDAFGYGQLTSEEISSIKTLAKKEGILLDPVYTGRAFN
ncbi:MAG: D-cysteine desulfhydrase family protein, partial [Bacteroidota bacterium]